MAISTIKSIMFYHRKSYHITFHIFTDSEGEKIISNYFSNFAANSCTKFRIYKIDELLKLGNKFLEKQKIINTHYSGFYALSKAFIHEVLPSNVTHVLLIDTDIILLDDVYSIWKQFQLFKRDKTALGLTPWYPPVPINYKYKGSTPDPFIAGVVLLDLNVCRSINFTRLLNQITETAYNEFGLRVIANADQTILSLFATYFSEHFVALPCFVNGHTIHYLSDGSSWKLGCNGEYPRTAHVVPSGNLLQPTHYFGHLYIFFKDMPIEWLSHCVVNKSRESSFAK
jgi:glycosyltransferase-like protein LARGE